MRFTITQRDGLVYASASELRSWSNGFRTEMLIGKFADLDHSKAAIVMVAEDQVRLVIDDLVVSFDPEEKRFVLLDPETP